MTAPSFDYSNLPARPPGRLVRIGSMLLPGVRQVQQQVPVFARDWLRSNRAALTATGPLWVALGDSMTQGIGADDIDSGWVGQALRRWGGAYRVVNLASSGATVADVAERQLPELDRLIAAGQHPALVTLLIGSNDLMSRDRAGVADRFAQVLARLPRGAVVANLPNPTRTATAINVLIDQAAAAGDIVVADLLRRRSMSWRGRLAADHFHPNALGYASLADAFVAAVPPGDAGADSIG